MRKLPPAKITTRENSDAHLVCMHANISNFYYIYENVTGAKITSNVFSGEKSENNHQAKIET